MSRIFSISSLLAFLIAIITPLIHAQDILNADEQVYPDFNKVGVDNDQPTAQYQSFRGYFYIRIKNQLVPVVYNIPIDSSNHIPATASNMVFYGPFPSERTTLNSNIVPSLVHHVGCSVFSFCFKQGSEEFDDHNTCYLYKESGYFDAVLAARNELIKMFGLTKRKLILMGYSAGGGMVLNLAGAISEETEAVASQAASAAPNEAPKNPIKWLIVENRGDPNIDISEPFYKKLIGAGARALYCEATPERGRNNYHAPSGQAYNLMYAFIVGIVEQRKLADAGETNLSEQWPYAAPRDPLKRYAIEKTSNLTDGTINNYDLLPSAKFAAYWSQLANPECQITFNNENQPLQVSFPAMSRPKGIILYYDQVNMDNVARIVEDVTTLEEHGYLVIRPQGREAPDRFLISALNWIKSQQGLNEARIHLVGYNKIGMQFIADFSNFPDSFHYLESLNCITFHDYNLDDELVNGVKKTSGECSHYGFYYYGDTPNHGMLDLAQGLVDETARTQGSRSIIAGTNDLTPEKAEEQAIQMVKSVVDHCLQ